jgi:hypothetical protein
MIGATGFDYVKHYVLEAQACRFVGEGDTRRGARLLGALEHLKKTAQIVSASIFHECFVPFVTMARETLGEEAFAQEKAAGAALTLEQALAYALET